MTERGKDELLISIPAVPPSANRLWRTNPRGGMFISKEAGSWYQLVKFQTMNVKAPQSWPFFAVEIVIRPKRRQGDVDNRIKPVLDALTKAGVWDDDDRVAFVSCEFGTIDKDGTTLIRITPRKEKYKTEKTG